MSGSPIVKKMDVIPVAGYDSMLMTLSGAHAPYFTRNLVILEDNAGNIGVGEVHGGESITEALNEYKELVIGQEIANYRKIINDIQSARGKSNSEGIQRLDISKLKDVVRCETAIEVALLDLLGKFLNLPVCALLGDGKQRDEVEVLGYLFYIGDKDQVDLGYIDESDSKDPWFRIRRKVALTPEAIVEQAYAAKEHYGFRNFKLKGGVLEGEREMEAVRALKENFPDARINIDPNGAWSLDEAINLCKDMKDVLTYVEDPCGPEAGFSGREILSEFKMATRLPVATNMIATDWRQFHHSVVLKAVDIVLADPHFWTMSGSVRASQVLDDWGMTWGCHSNNHFDISLAIFAQTAAAAKGNITAMDTHWIWQDGQNLCSEGFEIKDGKIIVDDRPGLGVTIDMDKVMEANALYNKIDRCYHDRDDAMVMQYLINGWKFDSKKPCLVRK